MRSSRSRIQLPAVGRFRKQGAVEQAAHGKFGSAMDRWRGGSGDICRLDFDRRNLPRPARRVEIETQRGKPDVIRGENHAGYTKENDKRTPGTFWRSPHRFAI